MVVRVEGGLFFANAETVRDRIRAHAGREGTRAIVLDAETVPFVDVTAAKMLAELDEELDRSGVRLLIARDIGQARDVLRRADVGEELVSVYPTVQAAVEAAARAG